MAWPHTGARGWVRGKAEEGVVVGVTATDDNAQGVPGQLIPYRLTFQNLADRSQANGVRLRATVPVNTTFDAAASYGSYDSLSIDGGIGGPIVEDLISFRASFLWQSRSD